MLLLDGAERLAWSFHTVGRRMHDADDAFVQEPLRQRREGRVDDHVRGSGAGPRDVRHAQVRVPRTLEPDDVALAQIGGPANHLDGRTEGRYRIARAVVADALRGDARLVEAPLPVPRREAREHGVRRRVAAREEDGSRAFSALEGREHGFAAFSRRRADPRVHVVGAVVKGC